MKKILVVLLLLQLVATAHTIETKNLKYIGMPVGGICTGQVYLGGDGQLWYWDIFNVPMLNPGNEGGYRYYINPLAQEKVLENGFALTIKQGNLIYHRALNQSGFIEIRFEGEYPLGKVYYEDPALPVSATLTAYSPFIPTDADDSGLPLTVLEYTITNIHDSSIELEINGWLQNMSCFFKGKGKDGQHSNRIEKGDGFTRLICESGDLHQNDLPDWGSMSLTLLEDGTASAKAIHQNGLPMFFTDEECKTASTKLGEKLVGSVSGKVSLAKGESKTFTYLLSWHFPNIHLGKEAHHWKNKENLRHYYNSRFKNASEVSSYVIEKPGLLDNTKKWHHCWYSSSLPDWFLDRTFLNVSTLATNACVRFDDLTDDPDNEGRFYTMEGVYLGHGTCTHVFHYEQALGRVFPDLARQLREQIDLGLSYQENGIIQYRSTEYAGMGRQDGRDYAVDGHAGTIMRIYREHTMAPDNTFLAENWLKIKQSMQYMIDHDKEKTGKADGILEGVQYNTLDRIWYGKITWISGMYAAALKAGAAMAAEMGDRPFERSCSRIADLAYENIPAELFNGEYFIQKLDKEHPEAPNTNMGCHTDQLLGQYWSTQVGLGDILPDDKVKTALRSIMKYNFVDHYGSYLEHADIPISRWYANDDEPGIIVCTFPKGGADLAPGKINNEWEKLVVGYFSEVWTGQEHHLAATLIAEGMPDDALKVEKAVNTRYSPERRNPYNEIEYGNHYTRAMSGYAPFVSASGFTYHGPKGELGFNPAIHPEDFSSAFITAQAWGTFAQEIDQNKQICSIQPEYGNLYLKEIHLNKVLNTKVNSVELTLDGRTLKTKIKARGKELSLEFAPLNLEKNQKLEIIIN